MNATNDPAVDERLRSLAVRLEEAWQAHGDDPGAVDLSALMPSVGDELRLAALRALVPVDLAARWRLGVPLSLEDYLQRFPDLGPADQVPAELIAEEHRIRARFGVVTPPQVLKQRFPNQYAEVERLLRTSVDDDSANTIAPPPLRRLTNELVSAPGLVIGDHYQLNSLLGRGGFGEVWHGTDLRGGIDKAIKVLTRAADSEEAQKELESLNIVKKINHPCVLRTESFFVEKDRLFIVLELADATLRDVLKKSQTDSSTGIAPDKLLAHMKHAAEGLDFLHRQGILHRDIKPENILVVGDYGKVADFGLVKTAQNKHSTRADFAGTVVYSAPETWDGRITTASDQYSLACTYFEMRTGRVLFGGKTFQEVFLKHMQANPSLDPLPDLEQDALRKALSKTPEDRYATCMEFMLALEDAVLASGSKVVESKAPAEGGVSTPRGSPRTRKGAGKSTGIADAVASEIALSLQGRGVQSPAPAADKKWNERSATPSNSKRSKVLIALAMVGVCLPIFASAPFLAQAILNKNVDETLSQADDGSAKSPSEKVELKTNNDVEISPSPLEKPSPKPPSKSVPPPINPVRQKLNDAQALFEQKKLRASVDLLQTIDIASLTNGDASDRTEALSQWTRLFDAGLLTKAELRAIDRKIADDPTVKPAFAAAMTSKLLDEWPEWPADKDVWKERLTDCERADDANLMIRAIKAEATIESGGRVDKALPPAGDEDAYITYVRALLANAQGESRKAGALAVNLPTDEKWFAGPRRMRAGLILQKAALSLTPMTPGKDGVLGLFASVKDANLAFAWQKRAIADLGNPSFDNQDVFSWRDLANYSLAAACKSDPDFPLSTRIGNALLVDRPVNKTWIPQMVYVFLANPAGFPKELAKVRGSLGADELSAMRTLGDAQRQVSKNVAAINERQAMLWYLDARRLDRVADIDPLRIKEADEAALALSPKLAMYQVALARDVALVALTDAAKAGDAAAKIRACEQGLAASAAAFIVENKGEEMYADLGVARASLFLEMGRQSDWTKPETKKAFQDSLAAAKAAAAADAVSARPEDISLAQAQAYEALAFLCRDAIEINFEEAVRHYMEASLRKSKFAFQHGRCLYRWATDRDLKYSKAKKDPLLTTAIAEFEKLETVSNFPSIAEAAYWEGLAHWDRIARITTSAKAQKAFEQSLKSAAKDPAAGGAWAGFALKALVDMTRLQYKSSPEKSLEWLAAIEPAARELAAKETLVDDAAYKSAYREYRDLTAETNAEVAGQYLKGSNFAKYRAALDRAVELNHSTRQAFFAVQRAIGFKKHEASLGLTSEEMAVVHREAIAAIQNAPGLEAAARQFLRKELDAGWR